MRGRTVAACGIVGAAAWSAPAPLVFAPTVAQALGIRTRLDAGAGVALTFDDGPHRDGTPAVLDVLASAHATATFFLVGEQVERLPTLVAEIAAAGHELALHGHRHRLLLRRAPRALAEDLARATAAIEDAAGVAPVCYRPPYGVFSLPGVMLCERRGLAPVLWSRWGRDWGARETAAAIARRATDGLGAGDVVLLHDADHYSAPDSWRRTVAALPSIIESAAALGEPLVSVTQST
jgi:peptidoglycan/xylan/chitin deacetylase (PgdA/CDA1 family)